MPKINTILFDFNSIVDIEIGTIIFLQRIYREDSIKSNIIDLDRIRNVTLESLQLQRMNDATGHLLEEYLLDKEASTANINNLLGTVISSHYEDVMKCSPITSMKFLIDTYLKTADNSISVSVLCENELQKHLIRELIPNVTILMDHRNMIDIKHYARIVVGSIYDILDFNDPELKDFLILNYRSNFSKTNESTFPPEVLIVTDINTISIAEAYITKNEGEMNNEHDV